MSLATSSAPELSGQQRRCHIVLMLYALSPAVRLEKISQINGVDLSTTRLDVAAVAAEIQRFHHLDLILDEAGTCRITGTSLNQRLCFFHWLRRALRISPDFTTQQAALALHQGMAAFHQAGAEETDRVLHTLIEQAEVRLRRPVNDRDRHFLCLFIKYCLNCHHQLCHPGFTPPQLTWLRQKSECDAAGYLAAALAERFALPPCEAERDFLTLLFTLLKTHSYDSSDSPEDRHLQEQVHRLIGRFQQIAGMSFSSREGLAGQLFTHLGAAIERCRFDIGIDHTLLEEVTRMYPRLMRTTLEALEEFEAAYDLRLSPEEVGLITICFGAWLMHGSALQEKQVLLLTNGNPELETAVEQHIRDATLLPLSVKYLPLSHFLRQGPPQGVTLVVTPYPADEPAITMPILHVELPLEKAQRMQIRALLESP
ncbi:stationary phase inducible protein CsiE [Nissabacter archeti]|uniref:stationary phase inducible protein CsiE n=1 Tax=Nissabacter archeti TaxID=1917880 RepID=UPI000933D692|nr:stationary phase inducible protein CsiE [Nissabacter archeti]